MQAIEDARFAEETAALDVWLVHQKGCYEEWKVEEWKEKQVSHKCVIKFILSYKISVPAIS